MIEYKNGDSIYETSLSTYVDNDYEYGWNGDNTDFPYYDEPFVCYGADYRYASISIASGVFAFGNDPGGADGLLGFRSALSVL